MPGTRVGSVTHYFDRISVAVLELTESVKVGDTLHFLGHSSDFMQKVESLQIEHKAVNEAGPGQDVAMKVIQPVRPHTAVFKITDET